MISGNKNILKKYLYFLKMDKKNNAIRHNPQCKCKYKERNTKNQNQNQRVHNIRDNDVYLNNKQ